MFQADSTLQYLVYTTFNLAFMAMAGGAVFFMAMKNSVIPRYQSTMIVSAVILFIAALNYYYMKDWYAMAVKDDIASFPTTFRYIDWALTTPLMLVKFPLLLGLGQKGRSFMYKLIVLDLIMIIAGFFGEVLIDQQALHYGLFGVGLFAWICILYLLLSATRSLPERFSPTVRTCVKIMVMFVLLGWSIYPLGYILPSFGLPQDVRELAYNIGDIINKLGLAIVVYFAAATLTKEELEFDDA